MYRGRRTDAPLPVAAFFQYLFIEIGSSMTRKSKAKLGLADERGLTETAWFRSRGTFNAQDRPLGNVYVLNDDILDSSRSLKMLVTERSYVILVPVVGVIFYRDSTGYSN